jgi:hypothetical protein
VAVDANGILRQPWIRPDRTSAGPGWAQLYVSTQREQPYRADFDAAASHLVILHLNGPVLVRRGHLGLTSSRTVPPGGFFVHPAGKDQTVELGGELDTVHVYLRGSALQEASEGPAVELVEELVPDLPGPVLRAWFRTDAEGRVAFWSILPSEYPIPRRRSGRADAAGDGAPSVPGTAPALHDQRARVPGAGHPALRRRRCLPRLGHSVRRQGRARRGLPARYGGRPRPGGSSTASGAHSRTPSG